uniref:DNA double-strand break repair rad50 ATPase n=1 Tax=Rhipicephalus appendiculatus TaxID=34631 RepID=A0A131Z2N4_RHIAP
MFSLRWRLAVLLKELDEGRDKFDDVKSKIERLRKEIRYQVSLYLNRTKAQPALYHALDDEQEGYLTNALRDVVVTLKEKFLVLGEKIKAKLAELKAAVGEHAVLIQDQLKDLYSQLQSAREDLKRQLFELFRPAAYASFEDNAARIYEKLNVLRQKLLKFLEDVKTLTGEKWEHAKKVIAELREEIRQKVRELLAGRTGVVMYAAEDSVPSASVIDTLKDTARTLKEKFQTLGRKIHAKVVELRDAVGEQAVLIKQQLESLKSQFNKAHSSLMKKLFSLFRPAQYGSVKEAPEEERHLSLLKQKLDYLLSTTAASPPEEWSSLEDAISELCQEIEEFVKKYE